MRVRYEIFQWLDMAKLSPVYGVRFREPGRGWTYIAERGKPALTYDADEAAMFRDLLRLSHDDCVPSRCKAE